MEPLLSFIDFSYTPTAIWEAYSNWAHQPALWEKYHTTASESS
jgi:hypothetical protein